MSKSPTGEVELHPLGILGVAETEERVYRCLIAHPGAGVRNISALLDFPTRKTRLSLERLESIGFVTHSLERPRRYVPVPPEIATKSLFHQHQEAVQRAQAETESLQAQYGAALGGEEVKERAVELIVGREAGRQAYDRMQMSAREEVIALVRPPILLHKLGTSADRGHYFQRKAQARGVRYRSIVASDFLAMPHALRATQADIEAGEEVRLAPKLPLKMIITDRRIALVPIHLDCNDSVSLLIRSSAPLDAFYMLFEILWKHAALISVGDDGLKFGQCGTGLTEETEKLLILLAAGLNDKKVIAELNMGGRTLDRRIAALMRELGAHTRFQLGWLARDFSPRPRPKEKIADNHALACGENSP